MKKLYNKADNFLCKHTLLKLITPFLIAVVIILLAHSSLETSCHYETFGGYLDTDFKYILLNIFTAVVIFTFFSIVCVKLWLAELIFSIICTIIALVNYYTIQLHSLPLTIFEVKNFTTAANVIGSYKIRLDDCTITIICMLFLSIALSFFQKHLEEKINVKKLFCRNAALVAISAFTLYIGYFSANPIKPEKVVGWSWEESYHEYGYLMCSVETIIASVDFVIKPEGYSEEAIDKLAVESPVFEASQQPDIIVILNETFYDLKLITDLETDVPYMENFYNLDNAIKGYAVVPTRLTNASEYELLTSNSLQLMPGITPFNIIDMSDANSIVSFVEQFGYETIGAHSEPAENYSRGRAYPAMGFNQIYFDKDFTDKTYYADRWYETDESLYNNLINWYENEPTDVPKFIYLLTIQNHGEYELNPSEADIVHVVNDYGDYNERINEFLSCIKLTDEAFLKLTEYFKTVERPVIICMVGDHSPTFAEDIVDEKYTAYERTLRLRSTPFVIWSNYEMETVDAGYVGLINLMPMVLETAGLPRSYYYQYLLDLQEEVPVISAFDAYMNADGTLTVYGTEDENSERIQQYFYMEYNNMQKNRKQSLFE